MTAKLNRNFSGEIICVLASNGTQKDHANSDNIIFTIKDTELYVSVITSSAKDKNCQMFLVKGSKDQCIGMSIKQKVGKNTANKYRYFLESNFVGVDRLFILVYANWNLNVERYKARRCYLPKALLRIITSSSMEKIFFDQPIDSEIRQFKEIINLTTGKCEDYTTGYLLDYEYIKNHHRLKTVNLNKKRNRC